MLPDADIIKTIQNSRQEYRLKDLMWLNWAYLPQLRRGPQSTWTKFERE